MSSWGIEQQKTWRKQFFEVPRWNRVRGLQEWSCAKLAILAAVDVRMVCPQDAQDWKNMLLTQAMMVVWRKWAAKHECEELRGGVWLEPIQAVLRRKTNESWTDKHLNVMRQLVVDGGWIQKRMYDTGWSDEKKCRGCNKEEGTEKHRLCHCPSWRKVRSQIPEVLGDWEHRA